MYSALSKDEKRALRHQKKKEQREYKQKCISEQNKENVEKLTNLLEQIASYQSYISKLEKQSLQVKTQNKKHIASQLKTCKLDTNFMRRNGVHTSICAKVLKGKECKYEDCWYAHSQEEVRVAKCISHMYGCCENGTMCKYDHTDSPLPELPKRLEYSYSLTESEEKELRSQYNPEFKKRVEFLYPDVSQNIIDTICNQLYSGSIKNCTEWILNDTRCFTHIHKLYSQISL